MPLGSRHAVVEKCKIAYDQSTMFMTILKGNRYVVIWKISGDYTVNQYFTNSDSTWWARHNQVVPLGRPGHEWVNNIIMKQTTHAAQRLRGIDNNSRHTEEEQAQGNYILVAPITHTIQIPHHQ